MKSNTLHMIGNAHIDPVWLWRWTEGFQEVKATFQSALDRMNEDPNFLFTSSSAAYYDWVEHNDPAMFAAIKQRVAEGRWELCGGWWIQPDCNIPGPEGLVRQGLYGQRYFQEKLGVRARVGYNVDSFGHAGSLPQILKKLGLDYYVFMRPGLHEKDLPARLFSWQSDDGSQVIAFRVVDPYCTGGGELTATIQRAAAEAKPPQSQLMCFYGVGNHGGGPTRENLRSIHALQTDPAAPRIIFSTPERYFRAVADLSLPVVHDDLQHHAPGCYSVHSAIKRWNRVAENTLLAAEKFSALAWKLTGQEYPTDLDQAWKSVLFNQFHDILAGTSLESAYEDARDAQGHAMTLATRALNNAVQSISWNIDIPPGAPDTWERPLVVFNPQAWPVKTCVEHEMRHLPKEFSLLDDAGQQVPLQAVQPHATVDNAQRITFSADLPALGYRVYRVAPTIKPPTAPAVAFEPHTIANENLRLKIDPHSGCVASLVDRRSNVEFAAPGSRAAVLEDPSDTWSHGVPRFDNEIGAFQATSVHRITAGPVLTILRVQSMWRSSHMTQDFVIYGGLDYVDVRVSVDWHEKFKALKLHFPTTLTNPIATYEIPYGSIRRPADGLEESAQNWIDLSGQVGPHACGLSLLNDGKYSFSILKSQMNLTVLRSPIYAHHDPMIPDPAAAYSFIDQGVQKFTYRLRPHAGSWQSAATVALGAQLNQPPIVVGESFHAGKLPRQSSLLSCSAPNVIVSVLKKAEDNQDLILRCYETAGQATDATLHLPALERKIKTHLTPHEIKTLRIPANRRHPVRETNLLED